MQTEANVLTPGCDYASAAVSPGQKNTLEKQTVRGGAFLVARYGMGVLVSVGNMLVMTRWIGPHAYGLFVTSIGLAAFLSSLARTGVDTYLVRRDADPDARVYDVAATLILVISMGLESRGRP